MVVVEITVGMEQLKQLKSNRRQKTHQQYYRYLLQKSKPKTFVNKVKKKQKKTTTTTLKKKKLKNKIANSRIQFEEKQSMPVLKLRKRRNENQESCKIKK